MRSDQLLAWLFFLFFFFFWGGCHFHLNTGVEDGRGLGLRVKVLQ